MGYWQGEKKFTTKGNVVQETKEKVEDISKYPFLEYKERGISKETCERFGVRAGVSESDGKTVDAYYFPSFNQKGRVVGYSKQNILIDKSEKGHWTAIGSVNIGNKLFGQDVSESVSRKRNSLVITEGQLDAMSVYQALTDNVKNTKYSGLEPFVVSIPLGTANAVESVLHNKDFTKSFDSLCIFFDDDSCTPAETKKGILKGHEAREALAGALLDEALPITTVTPDFGFKDASDYLQNGKSNELAKLVQFGKRPFSLEKVIRAEDVSLDEVCSMPPKGTVVDCFPKLMDMLGGFRMRELTMVLAPSGVGKCYGKGQQVLKYDLTPVKVENIAIGDLLLGPDGLPREVLSTHNGVSELFKVTPNKGDSYVVNSEHVLSLQSNSDVPFRGFKKDGVVNLSVKDFIGLPNHYKEHVLSGYFADTLAYGEGFFEDDYMLGLWLAEGNSDRSGITLCRADTVLHDYLKQYSKVNGYKLTVSPSADRAGSIGYYVSQGDNPLKDKLKSWGVLNNKHVPDFVQKLSRESRLRVLAGIIDGDGHAAHGCYELILKDNALVDGIALLARGLGMRVTVKDKFCKCQNFEGRIYKRILISGNTDRVPCLVSRKQITKKPNKNPMRVGLKVASVGQGEYFGFSLSGDKLHCLPDFQVGHNSSCCSLLASKFIQDGHKVGMIFLEESKKDTFQRMIAAELKVNYQKFRRNPLELATREQIEQVRDRIIKNDSLVLLDHFGSLPITDLMSKIKQMVLVENCKYIVLDHISAVISGLQDDNERKTLDVVMTNLASFCSANDVHIIVVSHINRTDSGQFLPQKGKESEPFWVNVRKESARGSAALEQFSSNIFALEPEINPDFSRGRVRWKILKTRFGDSLGIADVFTLDQDTWEVVLDGEKF